MIPVSALIHATDLGGGVKVVAISQRHPVSSAPWIAGCFILSGMVMSALRGRAETVPVGAELKLQSE